MKCPECGNDMILVSEENVADWWECPECGNEEPYPEFNEEEEDDDDDTETDYWVRIREEQ